MLFHTAQFGIFFVVVFCLYWLLHRWRLPRVVFLLAASCLFYMSWNPWMILLILFSASVDYCLALRMEGLPSLFWRRLLLICSVSVNLGLLLFFKYTNFLLDTTYSVLNGIGIEANPIVLKLVLPLGISFYTFETISYIVDVYMGRIKAVRSPLDYALYIMFFPHLIAGPIVRPMEFLPQLQQTPELRVENLRAGLILIFSGLFKKVLIADVLAETIVDKAFAAPGEASGFHLLMAAYGYAFQVYGDFSGYTDIARGAAQMLGYELPINFNSPYLATSIRDFWRRWHITLSLWLRDYFYIPLGGNRRGQVRACANLFLTLVVAGLWHGAAWNFVLFGVYHGVLLCGEYLWRAGRKARGLAEELEVSFSQRVVLILVTFNVLCLGLIIFRTQSLSHMITYYERLFTWAPAAHREIYAQERGLWVLALAMLLHCVPQRWAVLANRGLERVHPALQGGLAVVALAMIGIVISASHPFVYFQF